MATRIPPPKVDVRHTMVEDIEKALVAGLRRLWKHRDELRSEESETYAAEIMVQIELALDERFRWPD